MLSFVEVITTPSVDTPGTLLLLHFDSRRYLVGNVPEGAQRACIERGVGLRKVAKILATGRTEWGNLGGLLGLILSMADTKISAMSATVTKRADQSKEPIKNSGQDDLQVEVHGSHNLNHLIATSRRFIFRTGMPIHAIEPVQGSPPVSVEPTWQDDLIKVWSMAISPSTESDVRSPRKRTYDEANDRVSNVALTSPQTAYRDPFLETKKSVVGQMFNSGWKYDNLVPQPLSAIRHPAKIYVRDQVTKELVPYTGPLPGEAESVPDITVYVREPWPGALTEDLPPTKVATESMCFIIKNHAQRGKFLPKKAAELKVPKGMLWSELAKGFTVKNELGEDVTPEMVLAPGKEGGGCAIVDLPSAEYVMSLLQRGELLSDEIMSGVGAIIWILGPGVAQDKRLLDFQTRMSHLKHIVSSPDTCPNSLALDSAARNAIRHHHIDSRIFPDLQRADIASDSEGALAVNTKDQSPIAARRGLRLTLEPTLEIQDKMVKPPLDVGVFQKQMAAEFDNLDHASLRHQTQASISDVEAWKKTCPHPDTEVVVLGTGSSHPSPARNVSGTLIRVPGCGSYLLDCGEGTLGTLRRVFPPDELEAILKDLRMIWVSHLHADHHLGLASLVRAWSTATEESPSLRLAVVSDAPMLHWLHEYGSAEDLGLSRVLTLATTPTHKERLEEAQATELRFVKPAWVDEVDSRKTADFLDVLSLQALNSVFVTHCPGAQAVSFTTKTGLKISYSGDCRPSPAFAVIGRDSHLLIHEATFEDEMRGEALAKKHSTTGEALSIASQMRAKACLLTHFSQRYPEMPKLGMRSLQPESVPEHDGDGSSIPVAAPGQSLVPRLPDGTDIRVLFAFDYMRLRLDDIPLLEAKQPLLREMYDKGIGKDIAQDVAEEAPDTAQLAPVTSNRQEKKKAKEANMKEQVKANKRRSQEWKQKRDGAVPDISHEADQGVEAAGQASGQ